MDKNDDKILMEKNMIAIENKNTVFAYGDSAFDMYEKAPGNISVSFPLAHGVIADIKNMEILIKFFVSDFLYKQSCTTSDYISSMHIQSDLP